LGRTRELNVWGRAMDLAGHVYAARGLFKEQKPPEIAGSWYVVKSLEAALWTFHRTDTFRDGCVAAVNLGDDADTTAAVYGQLAGAFYGAGGIPATWVERLALREALEGLMQRLWGVAAVYRSLPRRRGR